MDPDRPGTDLPKTHPSWNRWNQRNLKEPNKMIIDHEISWVMSDHWWSLPFPSISHQSSCCMLFHDLWEPMGTNGKQCWRNDSTRSPGQVERKLLSHQQNIGDLVGPILWRWQLSSGRGGRVLWVRRSGQVTANQLSLFQCTLLLLRFFTWKFSWAKVTKCFKVLQYLQLKHKDILKKNA